MAVLVLQDILYTVCGLGERGWRKMGERAMDDKIGMRENEEKMVE